ncbi:MAG TPA: fatty acid desaturase [Burkholderiales bacterium]|nr:fatty acid desaturase [Betaproteobacteria bacterium]HQR51935.1 fatty acid desaturase [Burkholderiales bacterium]
MFFSGFLELPWWGYIVVALVLTHITIAGVTIYLHRHQAHRALELHPIVSHFFRFWLWLTTGMVTKEWAAIHRKHHAKCETVEDPHSPQTRGINKVLWEGAELYREEAKVQATLDKYGHGTPDDWIERNLYSKYTRLGITLMFIINFALFGFLGMSIWAVQMIWIPLFAAGVINGIGHYWGYRNFQTEDASRNIVPWGILIGGEELHNNHHAYGSSARLSSKWYEFDIGWLYIRLMEMVGLADVKRLAPRLRMAEAKTECDVTTLQAVINHRYEVMAKYAKSVKRLCADEFEKVREHSKVDWEAVKRFLMRGQTEVKAEDRACLDVLSMKSSVLKTVFGMRDELSAIWARSSASREQLVRQLEDWCQRAEASGIAPLREFSMRLRQYA